MNKCKENEILNPKTNRCIKKNGVVYKKLVKEGILKEGILKEGILKEKCEDGKVFNYKTKRCIKIGTTLYKKALKEGWLKEILDKKDRSKCKNTETFLLFTEIKEIPETDFIELPNGYCFSTEELVDYINRSLFDNKNPHNNEILIEEKDINKIDNEILKNLMKKFFKDVDEKGKLERNIIKKNIETLYIIGKAGRICFYNQITSFEKDNSTPFEQSIEVLQELSEKIAKLPKNEKEIMNKLYSTNPIYNVEKVLEEANNGTLCIHGVGIKLLYIFIVNFMKIEDMEEIEYESLKTGLYFIKKYNNILFISSSHRFTPNPNNSYYKINLFKEMSMKIMNKKSKMITKNIKYTDKTLDFKLRCSNEAYLASIESFEEWEDIEEWRKIRFDDNYCFDLYFLIKIITDNLNSSKNNNPYPNYPQNPFSRKKLTNKELLIIKRIVDDNYIIVSEPLNIFLRNNELWNGNNDWRNRCINEFEKKLRFKRLNNITDIDDVNINGIWVNKTLEVDTKERLILKYLNEFDTRALNSLKKKQNDNIEENYYYKEDPFKKLSLGENMIFIKPEI
jgi:hypothetical protein